MKTLTVKMDTPAFQAEMKRSGNGKVSKILPHELANLPLTAFVLIGNRTSDFRGGLADTGYIMQNGRATHSIRVSAIDVGAGYIRIP